MFCFMEPNKCLRAVLDAHHTENFHFVNGIVVIVKFQERSHQKERFCLVSRLKIGKKKKGKKISF